MIVEISNHVKGEVHLHGQSMRTKPIILFLCTGNSARSQMAEGFLRHLAGDHYEIHSAGTSPRPVDPLTVKVMAERGIDITAQRSKDIRKYLGKLGPRYVVVLCREAEQRCPRLWPGSLHRLFWPLDDPSIVEDEASRLARFRAVRDEVLSRIQRWLREQSRESARA